MLVEIGEWTSIQKQVYSFSEFTPRERVALTSSIHISLKITFYNYWVLFSLL